MYAMRHMALPSTSGGYMLSVLFGLQSSFLPASSLLSPVQLHSGIFLRKC